MSAKRRFCVAGFVVLAGSLALAAADATGDAAKGKPDARGNAKWRSLFDGKTLSGWKSTQFGGEGTPEVQDGQLILPAGDPLTGVTREKDDVPHVNYEVALEAQRAEGHDFFVGLTFPVEKSFASLILGGWAGSVCGISSIDHMDASENSTSSFREFKNGQWYKVRLRVLKDRIEAWVDDDQIVDADTAGKKISIRVEVDASKPFGLASYRTKAALRNIRIRELSAEEVKAAEKGDDSGAGKDAKGDKAGK
jgi:hypothetical protein